MGWTVLCTTTMPPSAIVGERAVGTTEDLVDPGVVDDADAQHVGRRAELRGVRCDRRGRVGKGLEGLGAAGPQRGRIAGVDDASGHGAALAAQADETDAGHGSCSLIIRCK